MKIVGWVQKLKAKRQQRRHFLLLEVLLAFVFVACATLPLLYPHFYIYQKEHQFIERIELDMAVNRFYGGILELLQKNQIPWSTIEEKQVVPIDDQLWAQMGYQNASFKGQYQFNRLFSKKNVNYGLYQFELILTVFPPGNSGNLEEQVKRSTVYKYTIFISRLLKTS